MFDDNGQNMGDTMKEEQQFDGTGGSTGGITMEQMIN
jgi:hypothetical protein